MAKKIILNIINVISVLLIIVAVFVLLTVLFTKSGEAANLFGYSAFRVSTGSMEPTLPVNTFIVVKETEAEDLKVGDVITFYSNDPDLGGAVNTHRIVSIEQSATGYEFTTKGDANNIEDKYVIPYKRIIGKMVFSSVFVGKLVRLLSNPLIFAPIIIIPLLIIVISNLAKTVKIAKNIADEEEEEAVKKITEALEKRKQAQAAKEQAEAEETVVADPVLEEPKSDNDVVED